MSNQVSAPAIPSFLETWRGFDREVVDGGQYPDPTLVEIAFYGGAIAIMSIVRRISLELGEVQGEAAMKGLERELQEFAAQHGVEIDLQ